MQNATLAFICVAISLGGDSFGQTTSHVQTFALSDTNDLVLVNVKAEALEYKGRKAVRLTKDTEKDGLALVRGTDFQDGTIEADLALKITTPPGVRMPGFFGVAFRAQSDASRYEFFYLRPVNSRADDQAMRNHSMQYDALGCCHRESVANEPLGGLSAMARVGRTGPQGREIQGQYQGRFGEVHLRQVYGSASPAPREDAPG